MAKQLSAFTIRRCDVYCSAKPRKYQDGIIAVGDGSENFLESDGSSCLLAYVLQTKAVMKRALTGAWGDNQSIKLLPIDRFPLQGVMNMMK